MTLNELLQNFYFKFGYQVNQANDTVTAVTKLVRRSDQKVIHEVKSTFDRMETNDWLSNSQSPFSLIKWDWNKLSDQTKRMQLDYFAQRIPIEEWYPINSKTDITPCYK